MTDAPNSTESIAEPPSHEHPLDAYVADPSQYRSLCDESLFLAVLDRMVANNAPRLFAVIEEYGERVDATIAAWGMAFRDHAEVVSVDHGLRMSLPTPEEALPGFTFGTHVRARLVWLNPDAATPPEDEHDELAEVDS